MTRLSVNNLIVSIGIAFDAQLKAADNLFFSTAVDFADPTRPLFGGTLGKASGAATNLSDPDATGYYSSTNPISGDPVTIRQIATADGPRYQITDKNGFEIKTENSSAGGTYSNVPRYLVKSDGIIYDLLVPATPSGTGRYQVANPALVNGGTGLTTAPTVSAIGLQHYARPVGRITFKAKEGATLSRAQDDLQRAGSIVQLLTRLLESIQDESKGFSSLIR